MPIYLLNEAQIHKRKMAAFRKWDIYFLTRPCADEDRIIFVAQGTLDSEGPREVDEDGLPGLRVKDVRLRFGSAGEPLFVNQAAATFCLVTTQEFWWQVTVNHASTLAKISDTLHIDMAQFLMREFELTSTLIQRLKALFAYLFCRLGKLVDLVLLLQLLAQPFRAREQLSLCCCRRCPRPLDCMFF